MFNILAVTAEEFTRNNIIILSVLFFIIGISCIEILKERIRVYKETTEAEKAIQREIRHHQQYNCYDELLDQINYTSPVDKIYTKI